MSERRIAVGVIAERRKAASPWIEHVWSAAAIVVGQPEAQPMTPLGKVGEGERFYLGTAEITLFAGDTANYRDNLATGAPKLWVAMGIDPLDASVSLRAVTLDPAEGEALAGSESNLVDALVMPVELAEWLAAFVAEFHVEREFYKRKRDRADLEGGGRRRGREEGP